MWVYIANPKSWPLNKMLYWSKWTKLLLQHMYIYIASLSLKRDVTLVNNLLYPSHVNKHPSSKWLVFIEEIETPLVNIGHLEHVNISSRISHTYCIYNIIPLLQNSKIWNKTSKLSRKTTVILSSQSAPRIKVAVLTSLPS